MHLVVGLPIEVHYDAAIPTGIYSLRVPLDAGISTITDSLKKQGVKMVVKSKTMRVSR
jgi:hypothetical protein